MQHDTQIYTISTNKLQTINTFLYHTYTQKIFFLNAGSTGSGEHLLHSCVGTSGMAGTLAAVSVTCNECFPSTSEDELNYKPPPPSRIYGVQQVVLINYVIFLTNCCVALTAGAVLMGTYVIIYPILCSVLAEFE